jgi:hypothetical protein
MSISETVESFAEGFVSTMRTRMGEEKPPCANGSRGNWTCEVKSALHEMWRKRGFVGYPWLLDFIWWAKDQRMMLAAESEFGNVDEVEDDFAGSRLPSGRASVKLVIDSSGISHTRKHSTKHRNILSTFSATATTPYYAAASFRTVEPQVSTSKRFACEVGVLSVNRDIMTVVS